MIIGSVIPLPVGAVIDPATLEGGPFGLSDHDGAYHEQPFVVLREATEAEHVAYVNERCSTKYTRIPRPYYYEIATD